MNAREAVARKSNRIIHWIHKMSRGWDHLRHKIGLELIQVDIQAAFKAEGGGDARDDLGNDSVQVREARGLNSEVSLADIVDGLVINLLE